jgi:nicotinamide-nucleotide amidase
MSARAGIVVTGTEVLTGRVSDRNGPWLAEQLRELGVDLAHTTIVGDRPEDMRSALDFMASRGLDIVLTSGGLGPTADDLTAEVVGGFQGREMMLDEDLAGRIAEIVKPLLKRWPNIDPEAIAQANRKQATIPTGSKVLEPVGTAPGLVVPPRKTGGGPTVVVLPGPPRELQPMFSEAVSSGALSDALAGAVEIRQRTMRLFGIPESEIAETLRIAERAEIDLERLEVTTCLKRGEVEVVTRYPPDEQAMYDAFVELVSERHPDTLFSTDGTTVDQQVAALLRGTEQSAPLTIATAESCTGGLLAARLTELAGSSDYVRGGVIAYADEVKIGQLGVPAAAIQEHGAVSCEVAPGRAKGAGARLGVNIGVGVTGVAGPGGGSEEKPVGLIWLSVARDGAEAMTRSVNLPGARADIRDRATTVSMHMIRRVLLGDQAPGT